MNKKQKPVSPIYALIILWFFWPIILPLFKLIHYAFLIAASVLLYKAVTKRANAKAAYVKQAAAQPQQAKEEEKTSGNPEVDKLIKERNLTISELRRLNYNIENEKISTWIDDIENTSTKIFDVVIAHPDKLPQISKFLNYYLPTTMKLLNTYDRMGSQGVEGENISGTMKKVEDTLEMVVNAFHKQLDTLFAGEALDVSADIAVMENLMKTEGLADDELNHIKLTF